MPLDEFSRCALYKKLQGSNDFSLYAICTNSQIARQIILSVSINPDAKCEEYEFVGLSSLTLEDYPVLLSSEAIHLLESAQFHPCHEIIDLVKAK